MLEAVFLAQPGQTLGVEVDAVPLTQVFHRRGLQLAAGERRSQLVEDLLEAPGRNALEDPGRLVARAPEVGAAGLGSGRTGRDGAPILFDLLQLVGQTNLPRCLGRFVESLLGAGRTRRGAHSSECARRPGL